MDTETWTLLAYMWRVHQHNPINHFVLDVRPAGGVIVHPASQSEYPVDSGLVNRLIRNGYLWGRQELSLSTTGITACRERFGAGLI